jgi:hypothetical protein
MKGDLYITSAELDDVGLTPDDVRQRCPWAVEYVTLDGGSCWPRQDLAELLEGGDGMG